MQTQNRDFDYETKKGGPSQVEENEYPEKGIRYYQALMNQKSLDGLPGLLVAFKNPLTSFVKERLQPITQPSTLSKVKRLKECKSGCEPAQEADTATFVEANCLKRAEEGKFILLAFFFGLVIAAYLPPAAKAIGSSLVEMNNVTFRFPTHFVFRLLDVSLPILPMYYD